MVYPRRRFGRRYRRVRRVRTRRARPMRRRIIRRRRSIWKKPVSGVRRSETVKLRYCESTVIAAPAGAGLPLILPAIRANGPYDPNTAVGGTATFNWSHYQGMYNHYVVLKSKCTYAISPQADVPSATVMTKLDDDGTSFTGAQLADYWLGDPRVRRVDTTINGYSGHTTHFAKQVFNPRKFFGPRYDTENYRSLTNTVPTEQAYFTGAVWPVHATSSLPQTTCRVIATYIVRFTEPKDEYNI